ncbi:MAG: PqqD family protein [Deltaproteobacteria bacterium]|nr:PqqD family protein [Deltaproteobacteria bacterium]
MQLDLEKKYKVSEDVVAREIEDEIVIVPIIAGIGSMDDDLYTLNSTGKAFWRLIDGQRSLGQIGKCLADEYEAPLDEILAQIQELVFTLCEKGIIVEN